MTMGKKIVISLIILAICEGAGIYLGIKYRDEYFAGSGYDARVVKVNDGEVIANCVNNDICNRNGEVSSINIKIPDDVSFQPGDDINFKEIDDNYYYVKSEKQLNDIVNLSGFLTGVPFCSIFLYFVFFMMFKKKTEKIYKYLPISSAVLFFVGVGLTMITEIDFVQGIGMIFVLLSIGAPVLIDKHYKKAK